MADTHVLTTGEQIREERSRELREHLGHLDALRGIAVLGVISIHSGQAFQNSLYEYINNPGMRGVQLFFVVSAFTLLLSAQRRSKGGRPVLTFFLRRYFRLAPLCYVFIVFGFLAVPSLRSVGVLHTLPALLFLQNFSPTYFYAGADAGWSLGVEAVFYLCFPLLVRWIRDLRSAVLWLFWVAVATTAAWAGMTHLRPWQWPYWSYYSFTVEFPVFLLGFVCFFIWRDFLQPLLGTANAKWLSAAMLLLTLFTFVNIVPIVWSHTFFSSITCALLLLAVSLYPWRFLVNRVTIFLGKISYSMYLIHVALVTSLMPVLRQHFPVLAVHSHRLLWWFGGFLAITAVAAGLGTLTWLYIEEPGIRLGRRVIRWVQNRPASNAPLTVPAEAVLTTRNTPDAQF